MAHSEENRLPRPRLVRNRADGRLRYLVAIGEKTDTVRITGTKNPKGKGVRLTRRDFESRYEEMS